MHKGKLTETWQPLACVSLHALARRIERDDDRSHPALTAELARLLDGDGDASGQIACADGYWLGDLIDAMGEPDTRPAGCGTCAPTSAKRDGRMTKDRDRELLDREQQRAASQAAAHTHQQIEQHKTKMRTYRQAARISPGSGH